MASQAEGSGDVINRFRGAMGTSPPMNPAAPPAAAPSAPRSPDAEQRSSQQRSDPSHGGSDDDDEADDNLLRIVTQISTKDADAKKTAAAADDAAKDRAIAVKQAPKAEGGEGSSAPVTGGSFFGPATFQAVSPPIGGSPLPNAGPVSPGASTTSNVWNSSIPAYPAANGSAQQPTHSGSHQTFNVSAAPFHGSANPSLGSTPLAAGQFSQHPPMPPPPQYPGTPPAAGAPAGPPANVLVRNGHGVFLLTLVNGTPTAGPAAPPTSSGAPHPYASAAARGASGTRGGGRGGRGGAGQHGSPVPSTAAAGGQSPPPPMAMPPPMSATTARPADASAAKPAAGAAAGDLPPTHLPMGEPTFARVRRGGKGGARGGKTDAPSGARR